MKNCKKSPREKGVGDKPRLSVFRSNTCFYVQLIDDIKGQTLLACNSDILSGGEDKGKKRKRGHGTVEIAKNLGLKLAALATEKNISKIFFDRSGYLYHGRIKALADGARKGGLIF
ncbi:MAG: 50S ribosomal protein L18 [Cytophagales bacterium]|jgi:large subunit ribosomal protein L18|nr:50S ribosomal protein L18 [Cytophagales bacterium]